MPEGPPVSARDGFDAVAREHYPAVLGYCLRVLRSYDLAEDVTQLVFEHAYRDFHRFEGRSSVRTWLFGIAYHRSMDTLRALRKSQVVESNDDAVADHKDPDEDLFEHVGDLEVRQALERCLSQLPPDMRATVLLRYQTGASYEQLAAQLDAAPAALQMRVVRAMRLLKRCLESKGWDGE
jgi:RNA polymerase sigma-70 factor (ECF subfamily)